MTNFCVDRLDSTKYSITSRMLQKIEEDIIPNITSIHHCSLSCTLSQLTEGPYNRMQTMQLLNQKQKENSAIVDEKYATEDDLYHGSVDRSHNVSYAHARGSTACVGMMWIWPD